MEMDGVSGARLVFASPQPVLTLDSALFILVDDYTIFYTPLTALSTCFFVANQREHVKIRASVTANLDLHGCPDALTHPTAT